MRNSSKVIALPLYVKRRPRLEELPVVSWRKYSDLQFSLQVTRVFAESEVHCEEGVTGNHDGISQERTVPARKVGEFQRVQSVGDLFSLFRMPYSSPRKAFFPIPQHVTSPPKTGGIFLLRRFLQAISRDCELEVSPSTHYEDVPECGDFFGTLFPFANVHFCRQFLIPDLDVRDSCCLIGVLNKEQDKLPALLAQMQYFETGRRFLDFQAQWSQKSSTLANGSAAAPKVKEFLDNAYVELLLPTVEVSMKSSELQHRFDSKRMSELKTKAIATGVPSDQANRLKSRDSEILATAIVHQAKRLTTYDPFLCFLGKEYITPQTGLIISPPDLSLLPFDQEPENS